MKHYIIVKFTEGTDVKALVEPVRAIFEETLAIPGIHSLDIRVSNSDIANRYDLMIIIDMVHISLSYSNISVKYLCLNYSPKFYICGRSL